MKSTHYTTRAWNSRDLKSMGGDIKSLHLLKLEVLNTDHVDVHFVEGNKGG